MSGQNASVAQYGPTATPTPTCVTCATPALPHTGGYSGAEVLIGGPLLVVGVILAIALRWRRL
jgi:hypothetical protein